MGILGGEWLVPNRDENNRIYTVGYDVFELLTDIDVTFAMSGQTDTGLTFGASIDLDESDGEDSEGASAAFDNREQGGEEIFISGAFGTLTMGDTDGALDWALQDVGIGSSLGDAHTSHLGYSGNDFVDKQDGDGQIARYDHSFGNFSFALSADIAEAGGKDILAAGAKYSVSIPGGHLGVGVGWQQREAHDGNVGEVDDALGASLDAEFDNGFKIVLNWVDMGDSPEGLGGGFDNTNPEEFTGLGLGYTIGDWFFAANYGRIREESWWKPGQEGYGIAVNHDLGGGAELQLGFSESKCTKIISDPTDGAIISGGAVYRAADDRCFARGENDSAFSLGVAMSF